MRIQVTNRLVTAVLVATAGVLGAVLTGRAEAAVLVAPWIALLVLGLSSTGGAGRDVQVQLRVDRDRVVVGNPVELTVEVEGLEGGWVEAIWQPPASFTTPPTSRPADDTVTDDAAAATATDRETTTDPDADVDLDVDLDVGGDGDTDRGSAAGEAVDAAGRAWLRCALPATSWGAHDVGRVELRAHQPFGLVVGRGLARRPLPIRVHPRPIDLRRLLAPWHVRRLSGTHPSRVAARGVEYADTRPYGPGDSPRDINWRASARSTELLVSQRHPDRSTHAILLVDTFTETGLDAPTVLGEAVEAAVALAESHLAASDRVGLIDLGGVVRWVVPGSGRHHLQRLVDALLSTQLYRSEADRPITSVPRRALPPRSFVLALSPLLDKRFIDALFTLRASGHDVAVVEFTPEIDPDAPRWRRTEISPVALRLWQAERDIVRDRLTQQGVAVARRHLDATTGQREPWDHLLHHLGTARRRLGPLVRS